jgi:hypothetical protein
VTPVLTKEATGSPYNLFTRIYVLILGSLAGIGGVVHGVAEVLQGNKAPDDILLRVGAFTIIPNYETTGIIAVVVGTAVVVWSALLLQKRWGPTVYLGLSTILALVGGGVALIPGSILAWAVSTKIRSPLSWWGKVLSAKIRTALSNLWIVAMVVGIGLFTVGFSIWSLLLPPGEIRQPSATHYVCWSFLCAGTLVILTAIPCGFARDLERMRVAEPDTRFGTAK